jgi:DNA modification methylase
VTAIVLRGDARQLPLPDASVDLIVTSPPYWGMRSYTDEGEHYDGQIGAEPSPAAYIDALLDCTREWVRVLKPAGSLFVNLGDKYANRSGVGWGREGVTTSRGKPEVVRHATAHRRPDTARASGLAEKSLMMLPARYAIACTDRLGLVLRAEIVWSKPNGLPESVTDRVRRAHEQWFHFTVQPRYYSAVDEIRETPSGYVRRGVVARAVPPGTRARGMADASNPLGALPGSVWEIPTQPLTVPDHLNVDHFAAFPMEWPRRLILGWSPAAICTACGEGRRPVTRKTAAGPRRTDAGSGGRGTKGLPGYEDVDRLPWQENVARVIVGYVCACISDLASGQAPSARPAVVLDPFGGTGTTALIASTLGRIGVTVDRSYDYSRLALWRVTDPGERARAAQVDKPPVQAEGQEALFG